MNTKSNNFNKSYRVGIDIGGTFTDIVLLLEDGKFLQKGKLHPRRIFIRSGERP